MCTFIAGWLLPTYRMIGIQLGAIHQDTVGAFVQVWDPLWEPGYFTHFWEEERSTQLVTVYTVYTACMLFIMSHHVQEFPLPSSCRQELSGGSISTTFTCFRSSWMISFSCSWLLSQSTKISNSELRLLDFLDSMCTRLTWFSYMRHKVYFLNFPTMC